jgi:hypothetical protein
VDRERKAALSNKFKVSGIPSFVILDKDGSAITTDGRSAVSEDPTGEEFPWKPKPSMDEVDPAVTLAEPVDARAVSENGDAPILVTVLNDTQHTVRFEWVDYEGALVPYKVKPHWQTWVQETYKSHPWRLTDEDSGRELARVRFTGDTTTSVSKLMQLSLPTEGAVDVKAVVDQAVIFEAANVSYGLSAEGCGPGEQLNNTRAVNDRFVVCPAGDQLYTFESRSGLCLGVGAPHGMWYPNDGFQAVLVPKDSASAVMRVLPARNGSEGFHSFEPVEHPGYLLNHCDGKIWFFDGPANNELVFSQDASWQLLDAESGTGPWKP